MLADTKYREALNFNLTEGTGKEFVTRLFNIDSNIGAIANSVNLNNITTVKVCY